MQKQLAVLRHAMLQQPAREDPAGEELQSSSDPTAPHTQAHTHARTRTRTHTHALSQPGVRYPGRPAKKAGSTSCTCHEPLTPPSHACCLMGQLQQHSTDTDTAKTA